MTKYKNFARRPLGVGVIGAGRIGTHRARLAAQHPAVEYLAIADTDQDQVDKLVNATGAQFGTTDPYAVIADERVSVVIVATPEHAHVDAVTAAIEAGKSVMVEKPLALTIEDADRLADLAEERGVDLRIG